jgi:hypothetical protein
MYAGEWDGATPPGSEDDIGNCPTLEVEVTEERLAHYSSRAGTRTKDKEVIIETGYTLTFELDEVSIKNLQMLLKGSLTGNNVIRANTQLDKEYSIKFVSNNAAGPDETWEFHRLKLAPNGAFSLIGDEWLTLSFSGEGLADEANNPTSPYFTVTFATTTTTTTV